MTRKFNNSSVQAYYTLDQRVHKFNQANFQEIPGGILRKIHYMFVVDPLHRYIT